MGAEEWKDAFVLQTICKFEIKDANGANLTGYKNNLLNRTTSWIAFGFSGTSMEVEISKIDGTATIIVGNASPGERSQLLGAMAFKIDVDVKLTVFTFRLRVYFISSLLSKPEI